MIHINWTGLSQENGFTAHGHAWRALFIAKYSMCLAWSTSSASSDLKSRSNLHGAGGSVPQGRYPGPTEYFVQRAGCRAA
jgi:hypothetical protein